MITKKVLVVGSPKVGKTSLITRWLYDTFSIAYKPTNNFEFAFKAVSANTKFQIFDASGNEKNNPILQYDLQNIVVVMLVFDLTDLKTLAALKDWHEKLKEYFSDEPEANVQYMLVGTKSDLLDPAERMGCERQINDFMTACDINRENYVVTSAMDGAGLSKNKDELTMKLDALINCELYANEQIDIFKSHLQAVLDTYLDKLNKRGTDYAWYDWFHLGYSQTQKKTVIEKLTSYLQHKEKTEVLTENEIKILKNRSLEESIMNFLQEQHKSNPVMPATIDDLLRHIGMNCQSLGCRGPIVG